MTRDQVMAELESLGTEKMREYSIKNGSGNNVFGLKMGDIRNIAKKIKTDSKLAAELWATGNVEAQLLSTLIVKPKDLSVEEVERMVQSTTYAWLMDWVMSYVVKQHPNREELREKWMSAKDAPSARAAWSLTTDRLSKTPAGLDVPALLDRIDKEMPSADPYVQWTMNFALISIGTDFPNLRDRAIAVGEKHGVYRDYPTSKGCTSPFAPIAIRELAGRKG